MYVRGHGDNDLPMCADLDSDTWDAAFLSNLGEDGEEDEDIDNQEDRIDDPPQR